MTSKATITRQITPLTSRSLKAVAIIIILAVLLDIFILPIPYNVLDRQWQINFVTQVVDRGIVPMVGLALLFTGYWVDSAAGTAVKRPVWQDLRLYALILASLLGLFYLLSLPLHLNNVNVAKGEALERITQEATQAETQLGTRLEAEVNQQKQQISVLMSNEDLLKQAVQAGQVSQEQSDLIAKFKQDPAALDQFIKQRVDQLQTQYQTEIGLRREKAQQTAKDEALKSSLRIGIGSLLLAIGYIIVGWTGLKSLV
ncbi:MAG TPA: HpsJ family protein [Chroococcidiopsis sp.]